MSAAAECKEQNDVQDNLTDVSIGNR